MDIYSKLGKAAGGDATASGASGNGGNIDSFSAANAARQNASMNSNGVALVLDGWQKRRGLMAGQLAAYGGSGQQAYNNSQSTLLNANAVNTSNAAILGTAPRAVVDGDNPYLNLDGTLKSENLDYQTMINNAPDDQSRAYAIRARQVKLLMPKYAKYAMTAPDYGTSGGNTDRGSRKIT